MALESLDNISELGVPLFALYLLIFCNFSKETLGCKLQYALDENMYFKHLMTFLLLFFLVILTDPKNADKDLLTSFGFTVLTYTIFIITTRTSFLFMIVIIVILLISYILNSIAKKKKEENNEEEYRKYKLVQNILFIILIIVGSTGFIIYAIEKYREYKDNFSLLKFIFGNPMCKNHTSNSVKIF
jgi:cbb3-type cytochrome oxidase subunit 3